MFSIPLSLRDRLSLMSPEEVRKTEIKIHKDILHLLVLTESFVEYIKIPLDGSPEVYEVKACYPLDACLCLYADDIRVYAMTKEGIYIFNSKFIPLVGGRKIKAMGDQVVILGEGSYFGSRFYKVNNEDNLISLNIAPLFSRVLDFDLTSSLLVVYRTQGGYVSIYDLSGNSYLREFKTSRGVFVNGERLLVEDGKGLVEFRILKGMLEQTKRIHLGVKGRVMHVGSDSSGMVISSSSPSSYYLFRDGVLYKTNSLISHFVEYKGCLFCSSREMIYFIPREKDTTIRLTSSEKKAVENILENKFSPFVTRTFELEGVEMSEVDKEYSSNGLFLSLLASQAFRVQVDKMICNTLAHIKKTGKGIDTLRLLNSLKTPRPLPFDFQRLYTNFSGIVPRVGNYLLLDQDEKELDFYYRTGDYRRMARLLHKRKDLKKEKYVELVGDYVFIEDHTFIETKME